jgi:hypothetical protein
MKNIKQEEIGKINGIRIFAIGVSEEANAIGKKDIYVNWSYDLNQGKPNPDKAIELNSILKMTQIQSIKLDQDIIKRLSN